MASRYDGVCSVRLIGNRDVAQAHERIARTEMGIMLATREKSDSNLIRRRLLPNGVEITCMKTSSADHIITIKAGGGTTGKFYLIWNPVSRYGFGWESPFTEALSPFGTESPGNGLLPNFDKTHKIAKSFFSGVPYVDKPADGSIVHIYGEQYFKDREQPKMPGNSTWTDGDRTLSYWYCNGFGNSFYSGLIVADSEVFDGSGGVDYWPATREGDIDYPYYSDYTKLAIAVKETSRSGGVDRITWVPISDLNSKVYVDGVSHILPNLANNPDIGTYVMGCGMVGSWIIYIDTDNIKIDNKNRREFIRAYNTAIDPITGEHEYRLLGTYLTYYLNPGGGPAFCSNSMKIVFSPNGLRFCMGRSNGSLNDNMGIYSGVVNLDVEGDPVSAGASLLYGYGLDCVCNYGFTHDNSLIYIKYSSSFSQYGKTAYAIDWDVQNGFFYAQGDYTSDDSSLSRYLITVMVHGVVYEYSTAIPGWDNTFIDFSSPYRTYATISDWVDTLGNFYNAPVDKSSCSVYGAGVFLTIWEDENFRHSGELFRDLNVRNIWIDLDGRGTDMGDALLNGNYTPGDLQCGPMIQVTSIEEE